MRPPKFVVNLFSRISKFRLFNGGNVETIGHIPDPELGGSWALNVSSFVPSIAYKIPWYIPSYLSFFNLIGISPYSPDKSKIRGKNVIRKILFGLIVIAAVFEIIDDTKYYALNFLKRRNFQAYARFGFTMIRLVIRLYFAYALVTSGKGMDELQASLRDINTVSDDDNPASYPPEQNELSSNRMTFTTCLGFMSVLQAFVSATEVGWDGEAWSLHDTICYYSYRASHFVKIWPGEDYTEVLDAIKTQYLFNSTTTTMSEAAIASCGIFVWFVGFLMDGIVMDLMIVSSWTLFSLQTQFKQELDNDSVNTARNPHRRLRAHWSKFMKIKQISTTLDNVVGRLVKCFEIYSMILLAGFLFDCYEAEASLAYFVTSLFNILKITVMYYVAARSTDTNKHIQLWIQARFTMKDSPARNGNEKYKISMITEIIATNPVGLGQHVFYIDHGFVYRHYGIVISLFLFLKEIHNG